ncbi:MAG: hypothetical protein JWP12_2927 [Bacteroidetes bacterium]|nr:hypothetical protein [Bacteroidota bacterium]
MEKQLATFIILFISLSNFAQQNTQYTQFMLNEYGLNPAVAGSSKGWMFMIGRRVQWQGFETAPETNFASITKAFGKKGYKRYWHGVGAYFEQDKSGLFTSKAAYASYAIHFKLSPKYYLSFGIAAGVKSVAISNGLFDANDAALMNRTPNVVIPDFIPGVYLYSKKLVAGVAVRNVFKNTLTQGNKEIGTGSKLYPNAYITLGRKFVSAGYDFIIVPAVQVQTTFIGIPVTSFNCMVYYRKRVGLGVSYRMHDAVSAMLQVRIFSNLVVGFAYDYTISKFRSAHANSTEFMMGFSPVMSTENYDRPAGAANCPTFEL